MTATKSVINIYAIGYKINIQLIYLQLSPEKIIEDFDLTYSQIAIFDWDNIKMTNNALKALLSGTFKMNINAIIRPYRILKGYIKGFKLAESDFNYEENEYKFKFGLLDDLKFMLSKLIIFKDDDINLEKNILDILDSDSNDFKLMTKNVYLGENIKMMNSNKKKEYIEELSMCKYLTLDTFNPDKFESLKYYSYQYDCKKDTSIEEFPDMNNIVLRKSINGLSYKKILHKQETVYLYRLVANTGEYYPNPVSLTNFQFSIELQLKDIKLVEISNDNTSFNFVIDYSDTKEKDQIKYLMNKLDARMLKLGNDISKHRNNNMYTNISQNICFESFGKIKNKHHLIELGKKRNLAEKNVKEYLFLASSNPVSLCQYLETIKDNFNKKKNSKAGLNMDLTEKTILDYDGENKKQKEKIELEFHTLDYYNSDKNKNVININILKNYICSFRELIYNNQPYSYTNNKFNKYKKTRYVKLSSMLPYEMKSVYTTHKIKIYVNGIWYNKANNSFGYKLSILF